MKKSIFKKEEFYSLLSNGMYQDSLKYLLKTNKLDLILDYQRKLKKFKSYKINNQNFQIVNQIKKYYFQKMRFYFYNETISINKQKIIEDLKNNNNFYYLIKDDDFLIWKDLESIEVKIRVLEGVYNLKINIISNVLSKCFLNYISLNKLNINSFIFDKELYIFKSFYNKFYKSKKFKLLLVYYAQYLYDLNKHNYSDDEINLRCTKLIEMYKNFKK